MYLLQCCSLLSCLSFITLFQKILLEEQLHVQVSALNANNQSVISKLQVYSNATSQTVEVRYREKDDSLRSWTIFFSQNIQVFKSITLGEVELGEPVSRFHCFITFFDTSKIAPLKVVMNLQQVDYEHVQKVDTPFDSKSYIFDVSLQAEKLRGFGEQIYSACHQADLILAQQKDLEKLRGELKDEVSKSILARVPAINMYPFCKNLKQRWDMHCVCTTNISFQWYPCASLQCAKFGSSVNIPLSDDDDDEQVDNSEALADQCGISACAQRYSFFYLVEKSKFCL